MQFAAFPPINSLIEQTSLETQRLYCTDEGISKQSNSMIVATTAEVHTLYKMAKQLPQFTVLIFLFAISFVIEMADKTKFVHAQLQRNTLHDNHNSKKYRCQNKNNKTTQIMAIFLMRAHTSWKIKWHLF